MTYERKHDIKNVFILATPVVLENLLQSFLGVIDTYFSGQIADLAIASTGVTNLLMNMIIAIFTALTVGTTAIVSRNYGKQDFVGVNRSITHSIVLGAILGLIVGSICIIFHAPLMRIAGANESMISIAKPYYFIVLGPSVILCVQLILSSCLRAIKDTKTPMTITAISNLFKIITSILFLKLDWGIFGLGLSTTLSRLLGAILLYRKLRHFNSKIHITKCRLEKNEFAPILKIGMPAGIEKIVMKLGQLVYVSMIAHISANAYIAHNISCNIEDLIFACSNAFGLVSCTFIGIFIGAKNIQRAKYMTYLTMVISTVIMSIIGILIFIFRFQIISMFTDTQEILDLILPTIAVMMIIQPFSATLLVMTSSLQGAGDTKFPMYATAIGIWGIRDGIGFLFAYVLKLGLIGCWYAYALDIIIRGILLFFRFRKGKWQKISI